MVSTPEPKAAGATADTLSSSNDTTTTSSSSNTAANSTAGPAGMSLQDQDRLTKLGVVLVNVGAAPEERVFGVKNSAPMQTYHSRGMTDLLVINRRVDDASAHPFHWSKPWTWWTSGPQVSPIVRVPVAAAVESQSTAAPPQPNATEAAPTAASATQTEEADLPLPPLTVEPKVKPKKKKGLPTVDMRPLTDDEVSALTPTVQADRAKMLKSEEKIHKALQNIEDTRYRYLVPARDLHCEAEVVAVVRCYAERNAAAARAAASDDAHAPFEKKGVVRADLLACGPDVQKLKKCANAMAMAYNHEGELA